MVFKRMTGPPPLPPYETKDSLFNNLRFLDIEASGLEADSYPTEFGICGLDLKPTSFLIRPRGEWSNAQWSAVAEQMTGISKSLLTNQGIDPDVAGERIEQSMQDKVVVSDNPGYDAFWLTRLKPFWLHEGVRSTKEFERRAIDELAATSGFAYVSRIVQKGQAMYPHRHRAGPDALRMAAMFRILVDAEFRRFVEENI